MAHGKSDEELVRSTRNTARYFVETRQLSWVLLAATIAWGAYGYLTMPQRKDPDVPIRDALAIAAWPGASAEAVEQLVTRRLEDAVAENAWVEHVSATTRTGVTFVRITLQKTTPDVPKQLDDLADRLAAVSGLPDGAGPVQFVKDFGDTAGLLLTVASPPLGEVELSLRARAVAGALERARGGAGGHAAVVYGFPPSVPPGAVVPVAERFARFAAGRGELAGARVIEGSGFVAVDGLAEGDDARLLAAVRAFSEEHLRPEEAQPDVWGPVLVRDLDRLPAQLAAAAGDKYSYRELDRLTQLVQRTLETVPSVSKVTRSGVLDERIHLLYSQERVAASGVRPEALPQVLAARNVAARGGVVEAGGRSLQVAPSGELAGEAELGDVLLPLASGPVPLRELFEVVRGYETPPRFLNFYSSQRPDGSWSRDRAITLSVQMRSGEHIEAFGREVDAALADLRTRLPEDLVVARTSDQPLQVRESVDLFMSSLWEAVLLVVLVSLLGFWEWRSALLMALSIPITLAMTFGMMRLLGIDLQQVSIASLIIALGLLVDDPVVAGDAIKRDLAAGLPRRVAAWLGPTKLATAILFATITNIVAYVPFLLLSGDTGKFLYSLPVVIGCSLVASRVVSMTFIPLLGYHLLRPRAERTIEERRATGFAARYYRVGRWAIAHRWAVLAGSLVLLAGGGLVLSRLKTQFFPKDLQYLSYVDVWLPEDASLSATSAAAAQAEAVVREVAEREGRALAGGGAAAHPLVSLTTFVGGGGPRFWLSAAPEQSQLNYAQIILLARDKHLTGALAAPLQRALSERIPGATVDVRQLETGASVGLPIALRLSGEDVPTLRRLGAELAAIVRATPGTARVRDDWGAESFSLRLRTDADRANLAGLTNQDVARASAAAFSGVTVGTLRDGEEQIPIVARLRTDERARLEDLRSLYVFSGDGQRKVPVGAVAQVDYGLQTERIQRRDKFRTVTVGAFPAEGTLPSEALAAMRPQLRAFEAGLPPGYRLEIAGEHEQQVDGFAELAMVMAISVGLIFLALVVQFRSAVKPLLVFAAIPYGVAGAAAALWVMGAPFGFMAFLGIASLVGVIVSHVIVLFDFIEEAHAEGAPLEQALLDAGILRLRPVLITVGATVIALFPLVAHGGPLWEPLCYAQIGGLTVATFVTLLLVPVLYVIFVRDLRWVRWEPASAGAEEAGAPAGLHPGHPLHAPGAPLRAP